MLAESERRRFDEAVGSLMAKGLQGRDIGPMVGLGKRWLCGLNEGMHDPSPEAAARVIELDRRLKDREAAETEVTRMALAGVRVMPPTLLPREILATMRSRGMTYAEVAEALGVSVTTLYHLGPERMQYATFAKMVDGFKRYELARREYMKGGED